MALASPVMAQERSGGRPLLLLVDGFNVVRRVHEAVPGDDTPERADGALKSSWSSILRGIRENAPTHFLAAFDYGGATWRHELYPDYKVNRRPMSEHLRDAMPGFLERMNNAGLRTLRVPGYEADDTLATLATKAVARGFEVVILSTDKDLCRLIHEGVRIRDHFKPEWRDESWLLSKFGIPSRFVGDFLALTGDETDGIPGVDGIGPKTAAKLLNEHGSLSAILEAANSDVAPIKGAVGEKLRAMASIALLSQQLASLKLDVPLGISPNDILLSPAALALAYPAQRRGAEGAMPAPAGPAASGAPTRPRPR